MKKVVLLLSALLITSCASNKTVETPKSQAGFDSILTGFEYPFPVNRYEFEAQDQKLQMAYMDVKPEGEIKKTIVLFHGKNFSGFYFEPIIRDLQVQGYRVIVPDQIGFGKSSKPAHFQYSFQTLARFTDALLQKAGVSEFTLVGHSMGGMLATRYALMFPGKVKKLVLVNPIGLEDYKVLTTYKTFDELYLGELKNNEEKIREYQKVAYYDGKWSQSYEPMIVPAVGWTKGPDHALIARNAALTSDIVYTQPVVYEFKKLQMKTTMINGDRDKTAPGKAWASPENQKIMGDYPKLGRDVIKMIPQGKLISLKGLGHMPFVEDYQGFMNVFVPEL